MVEEGPEYKYKAREINPRTRRGIRGNTEISQRHGMKPALRGINSDGELCEALFSISIALRGGRVHVHPC